MGDDESWYQLTPEKRESMGLTPEQTRLIKDHYDGGLAYLDDRLGAMLDALDEAGVLENTIVVLVADHGEHLGEHHLLDHQFSLYDGSLRVPLIVHAPGRLEPGRDRSPVMNYDLFPTLLELCGVEPPADTDLRAVSLLDSNEDRQRLAAMNRQGRVGEQHLVVEGVTDAGHRPQRLAPGASGGRRGAGGVWLGQAHGVNPKRNTRRTLR